MNTTLESEAIAEIFSALKVANRKISQRYPGDRPERQPVHTVYGGAQLFKAETAQKMGAAALAVMREYAPDFTVLARALHLPGWEALPGTERGIRELASRISRGEAEEDMEDPRLAREVYRLIEEKLQREAVEDFRIDFEDGYGNRPDDEEDRTAVFAADQVVEGMDRGCLPPFIGIRIKPLTEDLKRRALRTLDLFLTRLLEADRGLPPNFVVTLPKVTAPAHIAALVQAFKSFERRFGLADGSLRLELMVETTQTIFEPKGAIALPAMIEAAEGRCTAAHFGTYDYTASCDITARHQAMDHPVCDFARHVMKVALAGTGIWLSDGATNVMPIGPHRGKNLGEAQKAQNTDVVHRAWKLGYDHIRHSLSHGFYQGWDLHPAQLPIRYAACYTFFLQGLDEASARLRNFIEKAAQATLVGDVFDDAATGQGLLNYFLRAMNCGAIQEHDLTRTGLGIEEIRGRSFYKIVQGRTKKEIPKEPS